jgi:ribosomal protein L31
VTAATMRKRDIHPEWYSEAKVFCNGVEVMTVGGTKETYNVDVYSGNHPFYQVSGAAIAAGRVCCCASVAAAAACMQCLCVDLEASSSGIMCVYESVYTREPADCSSRSNSVAVTTHLLPHLLVCHGMHTPQTVIACYVCAYLA